MNDGDRNKLSRYLICALRYAKATDIMGNSSAVNHGLRKEEQNRTKHAREYLISTESHCCF